MTGLAYCAFVDEDAVFVVAPDPLVEKVQPLMDKNLALEKDKKYREAYGE